MCTAVILFAGRDARVHNSLFICSAPCMYARRRVHSQKAVYMSRASCLFADVCACVQSRVLICTSTCTRARFTGSLSAQIESARRRLGGGDLSMKSWLSTRNTYVDYGMRFVVISEKDEVLRISHAVMSELFDRRLALPQYARKRIRWCEVVVSLKEGACQ